MKNILIVQEDLGGGGAERVLIDLLDKFDYTKYNVDLLLLNNKGIHLNEVNKNVNLRYIFPDKEFNCDFLTKCWNSFKYRSLKHFPKLVHRIYIRKNYDVEIAFLEGNSTYLISKSNNKNSKKIAWVHIDLSKYRTMSYKDEEECYKKFNKIVCVSKEAKKVFDSLYKSCEGKSTVIYNLINKKKIKLLAQSSKEVERSFDSKTIISIGRLTEQKRFDLLIKAHKLLIDEGIIHNLLILGEGGDREKLEKLILSLKVEKTVTLKGYIENPYPYIKEAEVFAMTSDFEGFSIVISEALVLGKAIISTKCTGPSELLDKGEYGILTKCGDEIEIKYAIKRMLTDKNTKLHYENRAKKRALLFNEEEVLKKIYYLIEN